AGPAPKRCATKALPLHQSHGMERTRSTNCSELRYNFEVHLAFFNDRPAGASHACFERFTKVRVLERLREIDLRARTHGIEALDSSDPLVGIGVETDASGRVTKNSYGVLNLSWQAQLHPEWVDQIAAEVADIRGRLEKAHQTKLRYLIWAGMG